MCTSSKMKQARRQPRSYVPIEAQINRIVSDLDLVNIPQ